MEKRILIRSRFLSILVSLCFTFQYSIASAPIPKEGFINVKGGKVWYRINGTANKTPLLLLHGGPGSSSFNLDGLSELSTDRPVIFMDQLGCGRSSRITDTSLMTIQQFVEQLEQVRKALHLEKFYLYGHSWGTMLGIDYYLKYPKAIKAIIFSSPCFSTKAWTNDADTLIATLPKDIQMAISVNEKNKTYNATDYENAVNVYYANFVKRSKVSKARQDSSKMYFGKKVYEFMWGPSEFTATGNLLKYDRVKDLAKIKVPTLLMAGEFDEARPSTVNYFHTLIPGSEFKMISNAGHATIIDNKEETIQTLRKFLLKMDALNK
jgi:proline iminopeptidase